MMSDDYTGPCRACGSSNVRTTTTREDNSLTDNAAHVTVHRVCGNAQCPTNGSERSVADLV